MEYTDDAYKVLGVEPTATEADIKKAYRKLALQHHPDRVNDPAGKAKANAVFAKIAHAYEVLTDESLRRDYNQSRGMAYQSEEDSESEDEEPAYNENAGDAMVVRDKNAPDPKASKKKKKKKSKKGSSKKGGTNENSSFKYAFSDPYEVFKRDFEDLFGRPYPGAMNDFVDFNTPDMPPYQAPDTVAKDGTKGKKDDTQKKEKRGWFGRKKNSTEEPEKPNASSSANQTQLAIVGRNNSLANTRIDPSSALVKVEKKNNRPTACETITEQDGPITITKMKFTRPDGTVETVTMKTGIPGPDPNKKKNLPALTNGEAKPLALTNGPERKQLKNGSPVAKKTDKNKSKQLTQGKNSGNKLLALTNGETGTADKQKRKLLGWGGKQ